MSRASVTVKYLGDGTFRRYLIVRPSNGTYWTGRGWSSRRHRAILYVDLAEAHEQYQRLIVRPFRDKPLWVFRADLLVYVRTESLFTMQELQEYLNRAFQGIMDTDACGDGPVPECLVLLRANFDRLREVRRPRK